MRLLLPSILTASLSLASAVSLPARTDTRKRAAYLLSNNVEGDNLLALSLSVNDGTVSSPVLTYTRGSGLLGRNANGSAGPDSLFGQNAVVVSQDYLFAVNAGSNTLSMFTIFSSDPLHPKLVGKPVDTLGDFPMSITYSSAIKTACVLNGGANGGVTCFSVDHAKGLTPLGGLRPLPALHQTTPPLGPSLTTSDIVFNPSSSALFVTLKGDAGATPPKSGYIYAWPVQNGQVATTPVVNNLNTILMDFSINFLGSDNSAMITDPSFGASLVDVAYPSLKITEVHHVVVPFQGAACWGAYAARFNSAYIIDAGNPNITYIDPSTGATKGVIKYDPSARGGFDTAIDRTYMYILTGDSSVVVISLEGSNSGKTPTQVQKYSLTSKGVAGHWQGFSTAKIEPIPPTTPPSTTPKKNFRPLPQIFDNMSLADYLARNYLTADSKPNKKSKKRKRKDGTSGLIIADDDALGWNPNGSTKADEDAPVTISGRTSEFRKAKNSAWQTIGAPTPSSSDQAAADAIIASAASESNARALEDEDAPTVDDSGTKMESGAHAGLQTADQVTAQLKRRQDEERASFMQDSSAHSGANSETIYRDASGRIINIAMKRAEARKQQEAEAAKAAAELEAQKGDVQRAAAAKRKEDLKEAKYMPVARYADDADMNEDLKGRERWNDPAAGFLEKRREGKSVSGRPLYKGSAMPNRYGIRPGYRWDGVDRGIGFEKEWFAARNKKANLEKLDYAWQMDE